MTLDYLYGKRVIEVIAGLDGGEWALRFEDGSILTNHSEQYPTPPLVLNAVLQRAEFDVEETRTHFDNGVQLNLDPTKYTITDHLDQVVFPQATPVEVDPDLPPDPSPERVADGPDEEWFASQEAAAAEVDNASN